MGCSRPEVSVQRLEGNKTLQKHGVFYILNLWFGVFPQLRILEAVKNKVSTKKSVCIKTWGFSEPSTSCGYKASCDLKHF